MTSLHHIAPPSFANLDMGDFASLPPLPLVTSMGTCSFERGASLFSHTSLPSLPLTHPRSLPPSLTSSAPLSLRADALTDAFVLRMHRDCLKEAFTSEFVGRVTDERRSLAPPIARAFKKSASRKLSGRCGRTEVLSAQEFSVSLLVCLR